MSRPICRSYPSLTLAVLIPNGLLIAMPLCVFWIGNFGFRGDIDVLLMTYAVCLFALAQWRPLRRCFRSGNRLRGAAVGAAIGHIAGVIAYGVAVLSRANGLSRVGNTVSTYPVELFLVALLSPLFFGLWVPGGTFGLSVAALYRRLNRCAGPVG